MTQDKFTRSAQGQPCLARTPVCDCDPSETVLAHLNGGGMGQKHLNIHGCYAGFACHNFLDVGYAKTHSRDERDLIHLQAVVRTQRQMVADGVLVLQEKTVVRQPKRKAKSKIQSRGFGPSRKIGKLNYE